MGSGKAQNQADQVRACLAAATLDETVVLDCNVGPLLFARNSPYIKSLSRSALHDPGVAYFMRRFSAYLFPFFDVGANVGIFTILAAQLNNRNGRILAFEPDPANLRLLRTNLHCHGVSSVDIWPVALTSSDGPISLGLINCGLSAKSKVACAHYNAKTLRSVISESLVHPAFIKIDIEGGELDCLRGLDVHTHCNVIVELEFSWRDHSRHLHELVEMFPFTTTRWEFLLQPSEVASLHLPRVECSEDNASFCRLRPHNHAELQILSNHFALMTLERNSRKWELCISPLTTIAASS